jgi:hypothetical protein
MVVEPDHLKIGYYNVKKVKVTKYYRADTDYEFEVGKPFKHTDILELKIYENGNLGMKIKYHSSGDTEEIVGLYQHIKGDYIADGENLKGKKFQDKLKWFKEFKHMDDIFGE